MDSVPLHADTPAHSSVTGRRGPGIAYEPVGEGKERESLTRVRLGLQRRAPSNLRRHAMRGAVRFVVLVIADLAAYDVMRAALRWARDDQGLGARVAHQVGVVLPVGTLNGWQFAAALLVGLLVMGSYGPGDQRRDPKRLFLATALATALPLWMDIWTRGLEFVAAQYLLVTCAVWAGIVAERFVVDRLTVAVLRPHREGARAMFVGPAVECRTAASSAAFAGGVDYHPVGFVDVRVPAATDALGHVVDFAAILARTGAEAVVVCGYLPDERFHDVVDAALAAGCQLLSVPRAIEIAGVQPTLVSRRGQPLIELTRPALKGRQLVVKRVIDVVGALAGLVLLSPLFLVVALVVVLDSRGPVFFSQERVGKAGRRFRIWKFRTMVADAEARRVELLERSVYQDGRLFKIPDDPRITKVGRWLRRTSLDELPQFLNVLRGDMSLVGPRPPLPSEVALYEAHHYGRFDVKPGVTGPWQVAGRNEIRDFESVVRLEREYIAAWSLGRDVSILLRTVPAVFRMNGAH